MMMDANPVVCYPEKVKRMILGLTFLLSDSCLICYEYKQVKGWLVSSSWNILFPLQPQPQSQSQWI